MSLSSLVYLSEDVLDKLKESVEANFDRYTTGSFDDLAKEYGWAVEAKTVKVDLDKLAKLQRGSTSPEVEVENSLLAHSALPGMTRSIAREERVWARLAHVELLEYSRSRWLQNLGREPSVKDVQTHFFGSSLTQVRDDNAISRLWWNAEIARLAVPADPKRALTAILKTADIRSNIIERPRTASRPALSSGIVRAIERDAWVTAAEANFRMFMKQLNRNGGGMLFEVLPESAIDRLMQYCSSQAKAVAAT